MRVDADILDLTGTRGTAAVLNVLELGAGLHEDSGESDSTDAYFRRIYAKLALK